MNFSNPKLVEMIGFKSINLRKLDKLNFKNIQLNLFNK